MTEVSTEFGFLFEPGDAWLTAEVGRLVGQGDPFSAGVAVGLFARLREPESAERAPAVAGAREERAQDAMDAPGFTAPRRWARHLEAPERSELEDLGQAELHRLADRLLALEDSIEPEDPGWQHELLDLCEGRDDLACILFVLRTAGCGGGLAEAVAAFDEDARMLLASLPFEVRIEDERLRRASILDPGAWWAEPAAPR
jgi:hypothetical protein